MNFQIYPRYLHIKKISILIILFISVHIIIEEWVIFFKLLLFERSGIHFFRGNAKKKTKILFTKLKKNNISTIFFAASGIKNYKKKSKQNKTQI